MGHGMSHGSWGGMSLWSWGGICHVGHGVV